MNTTSVERQHTTYYIVFTEEKLSQNADTVCEVFTTIQ